MPRTYRDWDMNSSDAGDRGNEPGGSGGWSGNRGACSVADAKPVERAYITDLISEGPIEGLVGGLKGLKLNGTPVRNADGSFNYKGIYLSMVRGTATNPWIRGNRDGSDVSSVEAETAVNVQVKYGAPSTATVSNLNATAIRVKVAFPALQTIDKTSGAAKGASVQIKIEIKASNGNWVTQALTPGDTITDQVSSKFVRGFRFPLTGVGPWQVRVSRLTADATDSYTQNDTYFQGYTTILERKFTYPMSCVACTVLDAKQFSSVPTRSYRMRLLRVQVPSNYTPASKDPVSGAWTAATYAGEWDGTFKTSWTSNPAWIFYDIVTNKRYGAGLYGTPPDKFALYKIAKACDVMVSDGNGGQEPRYTCNVYLQSREDAIKVIQYFASVFRAVTYWGGGQVVPVQDVDSAPVRLLSPSNVKNGRFTYSGTSMKARHTQCVVYWNDPNNGYKRTPELVQDDDGVARYGINKLEVTAFGCTSQGQARRLGIWSLTSDLTETETVEFTAGMEGMSFRPGWVVSIADPFRYGKRMGGRIVAATTTQITLDAPVTLVSGKTYELKVSLPDGSVESKPVSTGAGQTSVLAVSSAYSAAAQVQGQWQLAASDLPPVLYKILSVKESKGTYAVTAVLHNAAKYAAVENGLVLTKTPLQAIPALPVVTGLTLSAFVRVQKDRVVPTLHADWNAVSTARSFRAIYRRDNGQWNDMTISGTSAEAFDVVPGSYDVRVVANYDDGASPFAQIQAYAVPEPSQMATDVKAALDGSSTANDILAAMANDGILTDQERPAERKARGELAQQVNYIKGNGVGILTTKAITDLDSAWTAWTAFIDPLIAASGKVTFDASQEKSLREALVGKIADLMSQIGVVGVTIANGAQASANNAQTQADAAKARLDNMASDGVITPEERPELRASYESYSQRYSGVRGDAINYGVSVSVLETCWSNYSAIVSPIVSASGNSSINFSDYVTKRGLLDRALADTASAASTAKMNAAQAAAAADAQARAQSAQANAIARAAQDALQKIDFLTGTKFRGDLIADGTVLAKSLVVANLDNLVPNPNSETPAPSGGWPTGAWEGICLYSGDGYAGNNCRRITANVDYQITPMIPCNPGDQFYAEAYTRAPGSGQAALKIQWFNYAGGLISATQVSSGVSTWTKQGLTDTAPANAAFMCLVITATVSSGVDNRFDNFYLRRMADANLLVEGILQALLMRGDVIEAGGYQQDASGNPMLGVRLDKDGISVGPNGMRVGVPGYGGVYKSLSINAATAMALRCLRGTPTEASDPLFYHAGNNPARAVPNTARLVLTPKGTISGVSQWDLMAIPNNRADALDALLYVDMEFYTPGATAPYSTLQAPISSRGYYNWISHSDQLNTARGNAVLVDPFGRGANGSGFSGYIRARLVGIDGPGNWLWFAPGANGTAVGGQASPGWSNAPVSGGGGAGSGGGDGSLGCVPAGTPLLLEDGTTIPIEEAQEGMVTAAWDDRTLERIPGGARIKRVLSFPDRDLWEMETEHGRLVASHDHRISLDGDPSWPPLRQALEGQETRWEVDGEMVPSRILSVHPTGRRETVYHIAQERGHVYCAGGIGGHNWDPLHPGADQAYK